MSAATMEGLAWYYFLLVALNLGACGFVYFRLRKPGWAAIGMIAPAVFLVLCVLNAIEYTGAARFSRMDLDGDGRITVNEYVAGQVPRFHRALYGPRGIQAQLSPEEQIRWLDAQQDYEPGPAARPKPLEAFNAYLGRRVPAYARLWTEAQARTSNAREPLLSAATMREAERVAGEFRRKDRNHDGYLTNDPAHGGAEVYTPTAPRLPEGFKDLLNRIAGPVTFLSAVLVLFIVYLVYRRFFSSGLVAWALLDLVLIGLGLSMTDGNFIKIVTAPDNVPIVAMIFLVGFFTWFGIRRAVINDLRAARGEPVLEALEPEKVLVWPDLVYTELIAMVVVTVILIIWAMALRAPLEDPAASTKAPNPAKAPWYFLGLQEMLVYYDPWMAGVVLPSLIIFGLMAIPFIDYNKAGNGYYTFAQRKFSVIAFLFGFVVMWVTLILLGTFLRGPNWNFFGPYEYWDVHKVVPLNNVNLSDYFWVRFLGTSRPTFWLTRELPGLILVLVYVVAIPPLLARTVLRSFFVRMGFARYAVLAILLLFMAALPLKMLLRWTLNLKYIVYIPEYFFNI